MDPLKNAGLECFSPAKSLLSDKTSMFLGQTGVSVAQAHEPQTLARIIYNLFSQLPGVDMEGSEIRQALLD